MTYLVFNKKINNMQILHMYNKDKIKIKLKEWKN